MTAQDRRPRLPSLVVGNGIRIQRWLELPGARILFDCSDSRIAPLLEACFEGLRDEPSAFALEGTSSSTADHGGVELRLDLDPFSRDLSLPLAVDSDGSIPPSSLEGTTFPCSVTALVRSLTQWYVEAADGHYFLHAGSVARDGRAIVFCGRSMSGKSSLVSALAQLGYRILSDELAIFHWPDGALYGFPRSLSLRAGTLGALGLSESIGLDTGEDSRLFPAAKLGMLREGSACEPALLVFPCYEPDVTTRLERIKGGPAVIEILASSCSRARYGAAGFDFVVELARRLPAYRLRFSDLKAAGRLVDEAFRAGSV